MSKLMRKRFWWFQRSGSSSWLKYFYQKQFISFVILLVLFGLFIHWFGLICDGWLLWFFLNILFVFFI
ncbi:hypothetical protein Hdeb2414_s0009g00313361 [Helianthus debilis subsp. tardiflorus]